MLVSALESIGWVVALMTIAALLVPWPSRAGRIAIAATAGLAAFMPMQQVSPAAFLLGTFGPTSAATIVLCASYLYRRVAGQSAPQIPSPAFMLCTLCTGIVFYPLAAGLTMFDPYDVGFRGLALPALMLVYLLTGWCVRARDIPCWIALAALLFLFDAYNSRNLWDYLIFPFDVLIAAAGLLVSGLRRYRIARPFTK